MLFAEKCSWLDEFTELLSAWPLKITVSAPEMVLLIITPVLNDATSARTTRFPLFPVSYYTIRTVEALTTSKTEIETALRRSIEVEKNTQLELTPDNLPWAGFAALSICSRIIDTTRTMLFKVQRHSTRKSSLKRFRFSTASQFALISISLQFLAAARELFSVLTSRIMIEKEKRGRTGSDCEKLFIVRERNILI